tara:strand:- start:1292 stop:1969 length:678 start_codon:yes stop_codon:yes gene_type:complete
MYYANSLSPFRGEIKGYLLPIHHYNRNISAQDCGDISDDKVSNQKDSFKGQSKASSNVLIKSKDIKIEKYNIGDGVSSLSISSIKIQREAKLKSTIKKTILNDGTDSFTQENLLEVWKDYIENKNVIGENNIAALLEMAKPELSKDFTILLKTSNALSQIEIKKEIPKILKYLCAKLNNYKIKFDIQIDEVVKEEYIYGVREKYDYLLKINPELDVLRSEFDLDI